MDNAGRRKTLVVMERSATPLVAPQVRENRPAPLRRAAAFSLGIALAIAGITLAPGAIAQSYPDRPVTIVVAYPPGGVADVVARLLAGDLGKRLGQPVTVDNRTGAAGMIGASHVARAAPNGHTLLMGAMAEIVFNPHMQDKGAYQPDEQLTPVAVAVRYPFLFVANPAFPARSAKEVVALARQNPDRYTYASAGYGSVQHIGMEMLTRMAGIKLRHIPYKGVTPALNDILGNQVSMGIAGFPPAIVHVQAGKLNAIGVSSKEKLSIAPNIPALAETPGLENYEFLGWVGLFAPTGTPVPILDKLHRESVAIFSMPEIQANLEKSGMTVSAETRAAFSAFVKSESRKYEKLIKDAGIKLE
jgi:tripartite-type tricarboxylate transporter receptor subunit TctC